MWTQTLVHRRNMMRRETWKRWPTPNQGERPGKDPSFTVLKRNEPCQHLNLRFLASRSVRKYISVVYTIHFYGALVWASQVVLVVKNKPANAGDTGDTSLVPGLGRSPGGGHGNPLQYSCLENPMDQEVWWATVHRGCKESDKTEVTQHAQ